MVCYNNILLSVQKNHKQLISSINPKKVGYVLPNGNINFSNEKIAIEYAKNKILQQLKKDNTEYGVLVKGQSIIGEAGGTKNAVNIGELKSLTDRFWNNSNLKRDVILLHGHPDMYSAGKTAPLSPYGGDLETAVAAKLKSIVAYNSRGEFNRIDCLHNFSSNRFKKQEAQFEELLLKHLTTPNDFKKLKELRKIENSQSDMPSHLEKWLKKYVIKQEAKNKKFIESEDYAKFIHEYYKKNLSKCGLKYTTNFNNLN